jgi:integrase
MASLTNEPHGGRRVQFIDTDGKRRSIRLGKMPMKQAEAVMLRIESLVSAKAGNTAPDPQTAAWVKDLGDVLYDRLARVGLVSPRSETRVTLGALFDRYLASITVKPSTEKNYKAARHYLEKHFGKDRLIRTITPTDAEGFKRAMRDSGLAQATTAKFIKVARQVYRLAIQLKYVEDSPFADVKSGSQTNTSRLRFVTREQIMRVMEACPSNEWRLLIVLSRFAGLRCPSEHMVLRWKDIDWDRGRITVHASKTAAHANRETRVIPLFPEVAPLLRRALEESATGAEFVFTDRYRRAGVNLGTQLKRIIRQAGIEPWPRAWHNLRASAQTELTERFPIHVVCHWLGNTTTVAMQHYLSVRTSDFDAALGSDWSSRKPVQNPAQQVSETARTEQKASPDLRRIEPDLQALSKSLERGR